MHLCHPRRRAFTLVELIVVILILGILGAVGVVGYTQVTDRASTAAATSNLRQITTAALAAATEEGDAVLTRALVLEVMNAATGPAVVEGLEAAAWKLGTSGQSPDAAGEFALGFDNDDQVAVDGSGLRAALVTATGDGQLLAQVFTAQGAGPIVPAEAGVTPTVVLGAAPTGSTAPVLSDGEVVLPPPPAPFTLTYPTTTLPATANQPVLPTVSGATGTVTYALSGTLPAGVTFDPATGALTAPAAGLSATQVAAGDNFSLAVSTTGEVWAWGDNGGAQLGDGTLTTRLTPVKVTLPAGVRITAAAAGSMHALALADDGAVWAWGTNTSRQLGDGTNVRRTTPIRVALPAGVRITAVAAGASYSVALADDGTVWTWGEATLVGRTGGPAPAAAQMPAEVHVAQISTSNTHTVAVTTDGALYAWGMNNYGQLGDGSKTDRALPAAVLPAGSVRQAAAGYTHTAVLQTDGAVYAWGQNDGGILGIGTTTTPVTSTSKKVTGLTGVTVAKLAAGRSTTFVVTTDGAVYGWGASGNGQLAVDPSGTRTTATLLTAFTTPVATVAPSSHLHTVVVSSDGAVFATGNGGNGQLGQGTTTSTRAPVATAGFTARVPLAFTVQITATTPDGRTATTGPVTFTRP